MKILILYRHFWPDSTPYASLLRSIGADLVRAGHEVTVWTEQPCYKPQDRASMRPAGENVDGIAVERFAMLPGARRLGALRVLDQLALPLRFLAKALRWRLARARYDMVWTATIPPIAQGMVGRAVARLFRAKFIYHAQDLYPELGVIMGNWRAGGPIARLAGRIERTTRERADRVVTLSDDMAATVRALAPGARVAIINNFMLDDFAGTAPPSGAGTVADRPGEGAVTLGFAGNIGQFQALDAVVDAWRLLPEAAKLRLELLGDGKAKADLQRRAAGNPAIAFHPHLPFGEAKHRIARFDLGLVSIEPGIHRVAYPSKTLTYLGLGVPIVALVDPDSDLARLIVAEDLGFVASARDPESVAKTLLEAAGRRGDLPAMAARARRYYADVLSADARLGQWRSLMTELGETP